MVKKATPMVNQEVNEIKSHVVYKACLALEFPNSGTYNAPSIVLADMVKTFMAKKH